MPVMLTIDSNEEHFARYPYYIRSRECMETLNWKDPGSLFYAIQLDKRYHREFLAGLPLFHHGGPCSAYESGGNGLCDCDYIKNRVP